MAKDDSEEPALLAVLGIEIAPTALLAWYEDERDYGLADPVTRLTDETDEDGTGWYWLEWHAPHRYDLDGL